MSSSSSSSARGKSRFIPLDQIKAATDNFNESNVLGQGGEAKVYRAKIVLGWKSTLVAVKHLKPNSQEFDNEIQIMSKIQHPNLVSLLGYCDESDQKILVYEYMEKGSLADYLKKRSCICLSWLQRLRICLDAARGLQHLHVETDEYPKGIIHRDVKPDNILLDKDWVAKISDFGMFKLSIAGQLRSTMITFQKGTGGYFAPEYLGYNVVSRKVDVYGFGVVLFQVLCMKMPWDRGDESYYPSDDDDLGAWALENIDSRIRAEISDESLKGFTDIIRETLKMKPGKRPTMDGVVLRLEKVLKCQERDQQQSTAAGASSVSESATANSGGHATEIRLDNGVYQPSANLDMEFNLEHGRSSKGSAEELIKQQLQEIAEGMAANALKSSLPSDPDLTRHGRREHTSEANQNGEVQHGDPQEQHNDKFEDIKSKLPDKANVGFPVSDGLGRLQIIKNSDLEELRELGSGTFGTVYHGKWGGTDVAIKRINDRCFAGKPSEQERMREDFWRQAINLADLYHPNVVAFYGVVLDGPGGSVATVTEYMVNGSLRTALQKNDRTLDKRKRLLIAMDVAFGMEYLHGKNIVNFDLKSDNLFVNLRDPIRPICKIGDLGLSNLKRRTPFSGDVQGTLPWMAPELLNGSSSLVSEKVDVFSFGIVMWELLTGDEPYADLHYGAIIGGIVNNTLRPPVPEFCDSEWKSLMERCWSEEPSERPSVAAVANQLRSMAYKRSP